MTRLPFVIREKPLGIVINNGRDRKPPVKFWAYMWATDDDALMSHWHEAVPVYPAG